MTDIINVLIADDHQIIRDGLKSLLRDIKDIRIVAEAQNGKEVLQKINEDNSISLILLDINMPLMNGIETVTAVKSSHPDIMVLALSMHDEEGYISQMMQAGASGYILKKTDKKELVTAIRTVSTGHTYFSSEVSAVLLNMYLTSGGHQKQVIKKKHLTHLTKREQEILSLIAAEHTNQEIADKLFISYRTVEAHRRSLLEKLGLRNTAGLVKYAIQQGLA